MKSRRWMCIRAALMLAVLVIPVGLAAQSKRGHNKHHHYKLIDVGTFGGPQSSIDYAVPLNNRGIVSGSADTPNLNPYYGNDNPTFFSDPYIQHTFGWKDDVLTDWGSLSGGGVSQPNCLNQHGDAAGNASNSVIDPMGGWPESRAVLYKHGQIFDLGTLDGGNESAATCLNDRGVVVGFAGDTTPDPYSLSGWGTQTHAFRWTKSQGMQDLGTLGTGLDAIPIVVNDSGQITGFSYTNSTPNQATGIPTLDPFLWKDGTMTDLGGLGGTASFLQPASGPDMNSHGQVVGGSNLAGDVYQHPFIWTNPGPMEDMGTLGGNFGGATRIDDSGEVAGWATDAEEKILAVLWKNGKMTNLGSIDGCSVAWDAKHGRAVGASFVCGGPYLHAFLWEHGSIVDLNTLVPPGSGVQLTLANYINESGEITAAGLLSNGDNHSFLLIPCDEHHPGIEGCDYSMAAGEVASVRPAQQERKLPPGSALWQRGYRFHLPRSLVGQRN